MFDKYKATIIGLIFTTSCLLLYYTFIVPFLVMLPLSLTLEVIFKGIYPNQGYSAIGHGIIATLTILFIIISVGFFIKFHRQIKNNKDIKTTNIVLYMSLLMLIIHPLVFYVNLSSDWSRAGDGQFILSIADTFQLSSLTFLLIGILVDIYKQNRLLHIH